LTAAFSNVLKYRDRRPLIQSARSRSPCKRLASSVAL
jgi:hypothetical protein